MPSGVGDVLGDLAPKRAMAEGSETKLQRLEGAFLAEVGELLAEAFQIAEGVIVDERDEPVEFEQGILERRRGQQHLGTPLQRLFQGVGDDAGGFVDVPQAVGLVDDHQVPRDRDDIVRFVAGEVVGADDEAGLVGLEGIGVARLDGLVVGAGFEDGGGQEELLGEFLMPLLAQVRRGDDEDAAPPLGPALREEDASLDGFPKSDLVGEQGAVGKGRLESE